MTLNEWMDLAQGQMQWIATHRTPAISNICMGLTGLGTEAFLLLAGALGYWILHNRIFGRAAAMLLVATYLNSWFKGIFQVPRPTIDPVYIAGGWSFPSGHAQMAAALWGWLAVEIWRRSDKTSHRLSAISLWILAGLIAFSRPCLGVHYPHDVVVGLLLGLIQVICGYFVFFKWHKITVKLAPLVAVISIVGVLTAFDTTVQPLGYRIAGALTGLIVGILWLRRHIPEEQLAMDTPLKQLGYFQVSNFVIILVGAFGVILLWKVLKMPLEMLHIADYSAILYIRYLLIGFWISAGLPYIFAPKVT